MSPAGLPSCTLVYLDDGLCGEGSVFLQLVLSPVSACAGTLVTYQLPWAGLTDSLVPFLVRPALPCPARRRGLREGAGKELGARVTASTWDFYK